MVKKKCIPAPVSVFCSCAEEDEPYKLQLEKHLAGIMAEGLIAAWNYSNILAGSDRIFEKNKQLIRAELFIALLSPDFISSNRCWSEVKNIMVKCKRSRAIIIPVILRPVDWKTSIIGHLIALPKNEKPLTLWSNIDEGFVNIVEGIREHIAISKERSNDPLDKQIRYSFAIKGTLEDFDKKRLDSIIEKLRSISRDFTLTLENTSTGSVVLHLLGTVEGLIRIISFQNKARLNQILQVRVLAIGSVDGKYRSQTFDEIQAQRKSMYRLLVTNLGNAVTKEELKKLFGPGVEMISVELKTEPSEDGMMKTSAIIYLVTSKIQRLLRLLNVATVGGSRIKVEAFGPGGKVEPAIKSGVRSRRQSK